MSFFRLAALGVSALAFAMAPALAYAQALAAPSAGNVTYDQAFFAGLNLNTAEDMLRRIPGVQAILDGSSPLASTGPQGGGNLGGAQERGFGSAGTQILLNGRRFPGKSNEITATLRRIPAASVARVELLSDAAAAGITTRSQGLMVNLVLREGASLGGGGSYEANLRTNDHGFYDVDGLIAYNRAFGGLTLSGGLERQVWSNPGRWTYRERDEAYYYPNGALQEVRPQVWERDYDRYIFTGAANYEFEGGQTLSFNGQYDTRIATENDTTPLVRYSTAGAETLRALEYHERQTDSFDVTELSGEYAGQIGPGEFTGLAIVRRQANPTLDFRNRTEPTRFVEVSRSVSSVDTGEDILRGTYALPLGGGTALDFGGEGARNTLKQQLDVFFDFDNDGRLEPAFVPISAPEVEERRGEVFATLKLQPQSSVSIEAGATYEYSELTTNYPGNPGRELGFAKPRLDMRWRPSARDQWRVLVDRTVSQLDFANFVPRYNATDDRVESGNPELVPEKTWVYEFGYERRLPNDGGRIDARVFYNDISDAIDKVPLRDDRGVRVSASGNIPNAQLFGIEARLSLRLGFVGLSGGQLNLRGLRQWSEIQDPFSGKKRRLNNDRSYAYDISFRHDVARWRSAYGFSVRSTGRENITSDLLVTDYFRMEPALEAFFERTLTPRMTLRFEGMNLGRGPESRERFLYAVNAIDGRLRRVDTYSEHRDIRFSIRLRGNI